MRRFCFIFIFVFTLFWGNLLPAQTHVSVPLDHIVYYFLDQAEARGLCSPLPVVRPYTRGRITEAINEILAAEPTRFGTLSTAERSILQEVRTEFMKHEAGLDLWKGMYRFDIRGKKGGRFSGDIGIFGESLNSVAYYTEDKNDVEGTDTWGTIFARGDVGESFSFYVDVSAGLMKAYHKKLGLYDTYATEMVPDAGGVNVQRQAVTYSQPMAFFPFTYKKRWDGFMFGSGEVSASGMKFWPNGFSIAPSMRAEISGTALSEMLFLRFGRIEREWGGMVPGSSLSFNAAARPFMGVEATFNPASWFAFSSLTGVLEFYNGADYEDSSGGGIYDAAMTFQNAFSIYQAEVNYGNILHFDFGSAMIWPKRFELGYLFPLMDNFLYQNLVGKTDNAAIFANGRLRYPGLGGVWFSFFMDEMEVSSITKFYKLDRHMFAYQLGFQMIIPGVPFASLTFSYTKVEPYNYSHQRNKVPWYDNPMEKPYVNNGVCLGYYIPPNSDEVKLRFQIRPLISTTAHIQYQLIRHGADFGPQQVDGSSLVSELDPNGRDGSKKSLTKNFLNDGAYQWMHIIKFGGEYKFRSLPLAIFGETGLVYSYFTTISDAEYAKYAPSPTTNSRDTGEYKISTGYILTLGFRLFK